MAFTIKVDEDLQRSAVSFLRPQGYDTVSVIDQKMGGWKDSVLWDAVQEEKRFLVTADKGFADVRAHPPGTHAGILLLRPDEDGIRPVIELLNHILNSYRLENLAGAVTVATPRGIRIRKT
jgi:predicted nuclease of predicted toxin-antitoxin system